MGEKIVSRLKNGEDLGTRLSYVWEDPASPVGSAGCLRLAQPYLPEPFLLSYSDVLYDRLDLADFYRFHKANGGLCTIALANSPNTKAFGVAQLSGARITDFSEKPVDSPSNLINAGVAICEPSIYPFLPKKTPSSFEHDLLPALARKGKLFGYVYSGPWFDVGKPHGLQAARSYFSGK
jgi:NDP-sugar pyrophosphorylase family protein